MTVLLFHTYKSRHPDDVAMATLRDEDLLATWLLSHLFESSRQVINPVQTERQTQINNRVNLYDQYSTLMCLRGTFITLDLINHGERIHCFINNQSSVAGRRDENKLQTFPKYS